MEMAKTDLLDAPRPSHTRKLQYIPRSWIGEFVEYLIDIIPVRPTLTDKKDNRFTLYFNSVDQASKFYDYLTSMTLEKLSSFISEVKRENPDKYMRSLVLETVVSNLVVHISY